MNLNKYEKMERVKVGNLQEQLAKIEQDLSAEKQKGPEGDQTIIARLESEQAHILEQIMLAEQQERQQEIEKKVTDEEITFNVPGVDFKELPAELITLIDRVVRADRRRIYAEEGEKFDELSRAAGERETNLKFQNEELQKIIETGTAANKSLIHENGNLRDHMATVNAEKADIEQKLRNAAAQIDEQENEISRLNSEIQDMRAASAFGEKQAQQIIDVTPEESSDMQNLVNSISKKYVEVKQIAANWHEATADDGSKTVVHTKDLPSLETQGSQFRGNDQTGNQEAVLPSVNQGPQFPSAPNVGTVQPPSLTPGNVPGESTHEQVAEAAVTRAEFSELERKVEQIQRHLFSVEDPNQIPESVKESA